MGGRRSRKAAAEERRERDRTARVAVAGDRPHGPAAAFDAAQRAVGNQAVQRMAAGDLPIQRYAVTGLARTATCSELLAHLKANSPYAPEAAHTDVRLGWTAGKPKTRKADVGIELVFPKAAVSRKTSVDMPQWAPTGPMAKATAWPAAVKALRAHEAKHERAGADAQRAIQARLRTATWPVLGSLADATTAALANLADEFASGLADHDAAQAHLDPYEVEVDCP